MPKYVIERTVPGLGGMDVAQLRDLSAASNTVLRQLGPDIQWVHSYVTDDKLYCVYNARDAEIVKEHARCGGFPCDSVRRVGAVVDPTTAEA